MRPSLLSSLSAEQLRAHAEALRTRAIAAELECIAATRAYAELMRKASRRKLLDLGIEIGDTVLLDGTEAVLVAVDANCRDGIRVRLEIDGAAREYGDSVLDRLRVPMLADAG